jgi:hypothetical protein
MTTGGSTNGINVTNSTTGRIRGTFSRTQYAVGTMIARLTMIVMTPMTNEYRSPPKNFGSARTWR